MSHDDLRAIVTAIRANVPKPFRGESWETAISKVTLHQLADLIDEIAE